jgi:hypothetical protein
MTLIDNEKMFQLPYKIPKHRRIIILNLEAKWMAWRDYSNVKNFTPTAQKRLSSNDSHVRNASDYDGYYNNMHMRWMFAESDIFTQHESVMKILDESSNSVELMVEFPYKHLKHSDLQG